MKRDGNRTHVICWVAWVPMYIGTRIGDRMTMGKSRRAGTHATRRNPSFDLCGYASVLLTLDSTGCKRATP